MYSGERRQDSQLAIVSTPDRATYIYRVENNMTAGMSSILTDYPKSVAMLPGMRDVSVGHRGNRYVVRTHFCLNAEPGARYAVKVQVTPVDGNVENVKIWLENEQTGAIVGVNAGRDEKCS